MTTKQKKTKVLLFKNLMSSFEGKEDNYSFSCGTHYLASALLKEGADILFSKTKIGALENEPFTHASELKKILLANPDINFICLNVCEFYFEKIEKLICFLRKHSQAYIGIGGIMPTLNPKQAFYNLPGSNFLVRGIGETILPAIIKILHGSSPYRKLDKKKLYSLSKLNGVIFADQFTNLECGLDHINEPSTYDNSTLDFSFFKKEDLQNGLALFSSWGCFNNCFFCSNPFKGENFKKTFKNLVFILEKYSERVSDVFGDNIPDSSLNISFYDDDFLSDPDRAIEFFNYVKKSKFKIDFLQTGINSFFIRKCNQFSDQLNRNLLNSLSGSIFNDKKNSNIFIGLENLSKEELKRLGKGYSPEKAEIVIEELAKKNLKVSYHFIASNQLTTTDNLLKNLYKFAFFQKKFPNNFYILKPIIPHLISVYSSKSFKIIKKTGRHKQLCIRKEIINEKDQTLNYPLVDADIPINKYVQELVQLIYRLFLTENDYLKILDAVLLHILFSKERNNRLKLSLEPLLLKYADSSKKIIEKTKNATLFDRNNIQLLLTRRCQLRCEYCPVEKRISDMKEPTLMRSIDLLFSSKSKDLRLDFTGGEPLLKFGLIKKAVNYSKQLAKKQKKNISYYMVTNLIALTDLIADFLKKEDFFLELSLDGIEEIHNRYKKSPNKKINPYQSTSRNLYKIFQRNIRNYAVMVINPDTAKYFSHSFKHAISLGFRNIGINYAIGKFWDRKEIKVVLKELTAVKKISAPYVRRNLLKLANLSSRLEPSILNNELMIDVNGDIMYLSDGFFEKKRKIPIKPLGNISDFDNFNKLQFTKFNAASRLFEYEATKTTKQLVQNNIKMGFVFKEFFDKWKKELEN